MKDRYIAIEFAQQAQRVEMRVDIVRYVRADGSVDEVHRRECPCQGCQLPITRQR